MKIFRVLVVLGSLLVSSLSYSKDVRAKPYAKDPKFTELLAQFETYETDPPTDRIASQVTNRASKDLMDKAKYCSRPLTIEDAKKYVLAHKEEFPELEKPPEKKSIGDRIANSLLRNRITETLSRRYTLTKGIVVENNAAETFSALSFEEKLEALARSYKHAIDEGCKMCGDEAKLAPQKDEILKKLGYKKDPPCTPDPSKAPQVILFFENHAEQERGGSPTAKRGLIANVTGAEQSVLLLTEAMSDNAPAIAQARLLNYFKLPVDGKNLNSAGIPKRKDARLQGLDNDTLIAVRTLQLALEGIESKFPDGQLRGKKLTNQQREAFFEFAVNNEKLRYLLQTISKYNPRDPIKDSSELVFGEIETQRIPMDESLKTIWTDPRYGHYRTIISDLAKAFLQNVGTVENGVSIFNNQSLWKTEFKSVHIGAMAGSNTHIYDDLAFYFLLRTLFYMAMTDTPVITTPESAGGLLRDWVFTKNIESAICSAQKDGSPIQKIVVNVGAAHATRVADLLRKDGFVNENNLRFLNAGSFSEGTVMSAIHSNLNHSEKMAGPGYKEECNYFKPSLGTDGSSSQTRPTQVETK